MTTPDTIYQNRKPNRLDNEKSPYLLQYAYNPVNWYLSDEKIQKLNSFQRSWFLTNILTYKSAPPNSRF